MIPCGFTWGNWPGGGDMSNPERESPAQRGEPTPSYDQIFEILSSRRRRTVLYYLTETPNGVTTVAELVECLRAAESSMGTDQSTTDIASVLQHVHLPKLEEVGVIEHDARSQTVRYRGQPSLDELLEHTYHKEH